MSSELSPEFGGECAFAVSLGKRGPVHPPDHYIVDGGKKYHFQNGVARLLWKVLPNRDAKADLVWASRSTQ